MIVLVTFWPNNQGKTILFVLILFIGILKQKFFNPFITEKLNRLELLANYSLLMIFCLKIISFCSQSEKISLGFSICSISIQYLFMLYTLDIILILKLQNYMFNLKKKKFFLKFGFVKNFLTKNCKIFFYIPNYLNKTVIRISEELNQFMEEVGRRDKLSTSIKTKKIDCVFLPNFFTFSKEFRYLKILEILSKNHDINPSIINENPVVEKNKHKNYPFLWNDGDNEIPENESILETLQKNLWSHLADVHIIEDDKVQIKMKKTSLQEEFYDFGCKGKISKEIKEIQGDIVLKNLFDKIEEFSLEIETQG